ncbi:MAG: DUF3108 domain-containing protein [Hyphomonadaceae bacterium]
MRHPIKLGATLALAAFAGLAGAQDVPTDPAPAINSLATIQAGEPTRMIYELRARAWVLFIPVTAKARFNVEMQPDTFTIESRIKTTGLADLLVNYDMNLTANGYVTEEGLRTHTYVSQNNGGKNRRVEMTYGEDDVDMVATPTFGNLGEPPATPEQKLDANDPITALITFALEPRAPGEDPCGGPIKVFDGRQLSWLHLTNAGTREIRVKAWRGEAIECHVTLEKVAGYKEGETNRDTLSGINGPLRMWLAPLPNGAYVPVKIQADTDKIGNVTLTASQLRFEPIITEEASTDRSDG